MGRCCPNAHSSEEAFVSGLPWASGRKGLCHEDTKRGAFRVFCRSQQALLRMERPSLVTDVGSQGRCSRPSRALRGRYPSAERQRRTRQPRGPREQALRVSAPPRRLPALFPQFALLPQSGPRLFSALVSGHTQVLRARTFHPFPRRESTFLTINLPATAGKVAGCEWGGEGRFAHSEAPELAASAQMACFLWFLTNKRGGMLSWPPAAGPEPRAHFAA
uniref:serine palmitoyltransferase small subunit B isoform X1 n=1 Tax=Callithrix jacchus TaxID=9483 RepID=UPI0023DD0E57|nr:serine palmitoyltransferase small subunit B isoform X1 [Callithrix jacchus]